MSIPSIRSSSATTATSRLTLQQVVDPVPASAMDPATTEERLFLGTNESGFETTMQELCNTPPSGNLMIATSGMYALDMVEARCRSYPDRSYSLLVLDRSSRAERFWTWLNGQLSTINLNSVSPSAIGSSRQDMIQRIRDFVVENGAFFSNTNTRVAQEEYIKDLTSEYAEDIERGCSWLSTNERFKVVCDLFFSRRFAFKRLDYNSSASFQILNEVLEKTAYRLDVLYVSNILTYRNTTHREFLRALNFIAKPSMLIVVANPHPYHPNTMQSVFVHGDQPIEDEDIFPEPLELQGSAATAGPPASSSTSSSTSTVHAGSRTGTSTAAPSAATAGPPITTTTSTTSSSSTSSSTSTPHTTSTTSTSTASSSGATGGVHAAPAGLPTTTISSSTSTSTSTTAPSAANASAPTSH